MSYPELIKKSLRTIRENRVIWAFGIFSALFTKVPGIIQSQITGNFFRAAGKKELFFSFLGFVSGLTQEKVAALISIVLLSMIVSLVVYYLSQGAMIHATNRISKNLPGSFSDSLRVGIERTVSLTAIAAVVWIAFIFALLAVAGLLFIPLALVSESSQLAKVLFFTLASLYVVAAIVGAVFAGLLTIISSRVNVIKRESVFKSIGRGYALIRKNVKRMIVFWFIALGFSVGFAIALSIIFAPFNLAVGYSFNVKALPVLALVITLLIVVSSILYGLVEAFFSAIWTVFYIDIDSEDSKPSLE